MPVIASGSRWNEARGFVFAGADDNPYAVGRTLRAFGGPGIPIEDVCGAERRSQLAEILSQSPGPVLLLRTGTWPVNSDGISLPSPSARACRFALWVQSNPKARLEQSRMRR